jgi:hypothetical protein
MSEERLIEVQATLNRIEKKIDASATTFAAHVAEDKLLAASVQQLVGRQRGRIHTGLATVVASVSAAAAWAVSRFGSGGH